MLSEIDNNADVVWNSVKTVVTKKGTEDFRPKNDEEWAVVRHGAITLVEAPNLLIMEGRKVDKPGGKSENPGIELEPEQIEAKINADRATWIKLAHALQDEARNVLKAVDEKNADALIDAGSRLDEACENCHVTYWYPNDVRPPLSSLSQAPSK